MDHSYQISKRLIYNGKHIKFNLNEQNKIDYNKYISNKS